MTKNSHLIYVGNFRFPDGDAGGRRVYGIGLALRDAGFDVTFVGAEVTGRHEDLVAGGGYSYKGFPYYPAGASGKGLVQRAWRLFYVHASGVSTISRIEKELTPSTVGVIAYQATSPVLLRLSRFCHRKGLFLASDVVEWYDRKHVGGGRFGPFALDSEIRMRYFHRRTDGIITISRYLEDYYRKFSCAVVRVPPLIDSEDDCWRRPAPSVISDDILRIGFFGSAGKKDLVSHAIRGLSMLGHDSRYFKLNIVGPSAKELYLSLGRDSGILNRLSSTINISGRMKRNEALRVLGNSDFTFLIRRDARFSRAGFPTKLVESLAMGVPVIVNVTGDIGLYVRDGIEGIVTGDSTAAAFAEGLRRAMYLKLEEKQQMRLNARRRALESFDYRNWISTLGNFANGRTRGA